MSRLCRCAAVALVMSTPLFSSADPREDTPPAVEITSSFNEGRENFRPIDNPISVVEQLHGLLFHWKPEHGGEADLDCFPAEDLATSFPEIIQWEVPGQVISGIRHERLGPLLVEAAKEIEVQVEECYILLHALAERFRLLDDRVSEHGSRLSSQETEISRLRQKIAAQDCLIAELQQKDRALEQSVAQLQSEIAALQAAVAALQGGGQ